MQLHQLVAAAAPLGLVGPVRAQAVRTALRDLGPHLGQVAVRSPRIPDHAYSGSDVPRARVTVSLSPSIVGGDLVGERGEHRPREPVAVRRPRRVARRGHRDGRARRVEVERARQVGVRPSAWGSTMAHASSTAMRRSSMSSRVKSSGPRDPRSRCGAPRGRRCRPGCAARRPGGCSPTSSGFLRRSQRSGVGRASRPTHLRRCRSVGSGCDDWPQSVRPSWSPRRSRRSRRSWRAARRPSPASSAPLVPVAPASLVASLTSVVQLRVLLEVRRLEVVGPQHPQVVLDQLGALLLDEDRRGCGSRGRRCRRPWR